MMTPLEMIYSAGCSLKRHYSRKQMRRLPSGVVSIGNITVGGTGKTPAVLAVAGAALNRGFRPVILTRGYRGKARGPCFVNRNGTILLGPEDAGDEPVLLARRLPDVPVIKCPDRYEGGIFALTELSAHPHERFLFILDDGFQHWRLFRDFDAVLIDGANPFGNRRLLPLGPLREPLSEISRADALIITKLRNPVLAQELSARFPRTPVFFGDYRVSALRSIDGTVVPHHFITSAPVLAFCGIAGPESFRTTVKGLAGDLRGFVAFGDHHRYKKKDIETLEKKRQELGCGALVTTEKDLVKLHGTGLRNVYGVIMDMTMEEGFFDMIFTAAGR